MTVRIALVSCSNGLGHVRRLIHLANAFLSLTPCKISLFCPAKSFDKLGRTLSTRYISNVDFDSSTKISDWISGKATQWIHTIPSLSEYRHVVSDNLLEIVHIRPDAWLSGSFFWHKSLPNISKEIIASSQRLLFKHNPRMISTSLFAAPYLQDLTRLHQVGLFGDRTSACQNEQTSLLISCGTGGSCSTKYNLDSLDQNTLLSLELHYSTIWVDPTLYNKRLPNLFQPATYSASMYNSLSCAIIRPGIGTITDCLAASCRMYLLYEGANFEMKHNANQLSQHGLGHIVSSLDEALHLATLQPNPPHLFDNFHAAIDSLSFTGAHQAAKLILSI